MTTSVFKPVPEYSFEQAVVVRKATLGFCQFSELTIHRFHLPLITSGVLYSDQRTELSWVETPSNSHSAVLKCNFYFISHAVNLVIVFKYLIADQAGDRPEIFSFQSFIHSALAVVVSQTKVETENNPVYL